MTADKVSVEKAEWKTNGKGAAPNQAWQAAIPFIILLIIALALPFAQNNYWTVIATRASIYWLLVSGLTLVMGYAGQLAIGYVALLALGGYTSSVLVAGNVFSSPMSPFVALGFAGLVGGLFGVVMGLPALRLRTFYYAITTLGFSTIVTQIALAWKDVTGAGVGLPGPLMPAPFDTNEGLYYLCLAAAGIATLLSGNIARSRFGRNLIAIRDSEVAAEAFGVSKAKLFSMVFFFSGILAGVAGGLFSSLQTYITPDAFTFNLSLLFFTCVLIGGRSSILGPLLGTIILTALPEFAAPLAAWSNFLYAALVLAIVLVMPGGIAALLDFKNRRPLAVNRDVKPKPEVLSEFLQHSSLQSGLILNHINLSYGGVKAVDDLSMTILPGQVHGLIGPNGSGKTTTLNVLSGYAKPQRGTLLESGETLETGLSVSRARRGMARTFQTPHVIGDISVLDNVMIGGSSRAQGTFVESVFHAGRHRTDEAFLRETAEKALLAVGLDNLAHVRADRLQHSELRFLEIARALMLCPKYLLLDEPAAGLSAIEIQRLGHLVKAISACGTGILLVEHHADLIFDICDHVTVLNLGRVLVSGSPNDVRSHKEVISAYLGG